MQVTFKKYYYAFLSLATLTLLASAQSVFALPVYPGDVTTGPPPALFDISVQPVFAGISVVNIIILLAVIILAGLGLIYIAHKIYKKRRLQKIREINGTK